MSKNVGQILYFQVLRVNLIKRLRACLKFLSVKEIAKDQLGPETWALNARERSRL